jgi:hypothetical protein
MTAPVELSTAEMWQLSAVGGCLLMAVQEEGVDRDKVIEAANRLFDLMNQIEQRDDWSSRSPVGEASAACLRLPSSDTN